MLLPSAPYREGNSVVADPPKRRFSYEDRHGEFIEIRADHCLISSGALVFTDGPEYVAVNTLVVALAPGSWKSCVEVTE